ncbi:MAG: hypothetical protein IT164_17895 [Bryobacterales bacterium]|nr:hypothetical protein [Bryobacterales bacterium]
MKPFVSLFCLSAACCVPLLAQSAPQLARLYSYEIPPDAAAEFYDLQRDTAEIYKTNKAPFPRLCWTSLTGPPALYMWVPLTGLDKLMDRTWLSQQGEELPRVARASRLARTGASPTIRITRTLPELTWDDTPNGAPEAFASVRVDSVKPGKVSEYTAMMKEVMATYKKMGAAKSFHANRTAFGGDGYEFTTIAGYASLADIPDPDAFRKAMGEARYDTFVKQLGEVLAKSERTLARYRPEFSYMPEAK